MEKKMNEVKYLFLAFGTKKIVMELHIHKRNTNGPSYGHLCGPTEYIKLLAEKMPEALCLENSDGEVEEVLFNVQWTQTYRKVGSPQKSWSQTYQKISDSVRDDAIVNISWNAITSDYYHQVMKHSM